MNRFGRFLEVSMPAPDIQASLAFYRDLGFTELRTGDIRDYFYAVVSDGHIAVGLHASALDQPALSFVHADVAGMVRELEDLGIEIEPRRLGIDTFNEAGLQDPDGNRVMLLEAPTFTRVSGDNVPAPVTGRSACVVLPSRAPEKSAGFWTRHGFIADETGHDTKCRLLTPGLILELDPELTGSMPRLEMRGGDADKLAAVLAHGNIKTASIPGGLLLTSPEGLELAVEI